MTRIPPPQVSFVERLITVVRYPDLVSLAKDRGYKSRTTTALYNKKQRESRKNYEDFLRNFIRTQELSAVSTLNDDMLIIVAREMNRRITVFPQTEG